MRFSEFVLAIVVAVGLVIGKSAALAQEGTSKGVADCPSIGVQFEKAFGAVVAEYPGGDTGNNYEGVIDFVRRTLPKRISPECIEAALANIDESYYGPSAEEYVFYIPAIEYYSIFGITTNIQRFSYWIYFVLAEDGSIRSLMIVPKK